MDLFIRFIVAVCWLLVINVLLLQVYATAAVSTSSAPTTHIVSFVNQKRNRAKYDEFSEFDIEPFGAGKSPDHRMLAPAGIRQLLGRYVQQIDPNMDDNSITVELTAARTTMPTNSRSQQTDDLHTPNRNTLNDANEIFGHNEQHETSRSAMTNGSVDLTMPDRVKQSIPVLEPVKHLLNTVRDGGFNHANNTKAHHQLVPNETAAIETEEDRETVADSTGFQFLELLGSIAGMVWGFISNFTKIFAASAASSSGGSQ